MILQNGISRPSSACFRTGVRAALLLAAFGQGLDSRLAYLGGGRGDTSELRRDDVTVLGSNGLVPIDGLADWLYYAN